MSQPASSSATRMEKIVSLCKRRGFIFQSSEIYGGINGFWDYGPLGAELKRNVKDAWWKSMTKMRDDVVGLDASIIMHPQIWKASGHVDTFADMMSECPLTKKRVRSDQVDPVTGIAYYYTGATGEGGSKSEEAFSVLIAVGKPPESARKVANQFYELRGVKTPTLEGERSEKLENTTLYHPESGCRLTEPRPFNLMLQTYVGPIQSEENKAYLRPETAQAIFAQFKNVVDTSRQKVPFGIAQIGKAFRNEVTPRNYIFRSREFEQMELEFFIKPDEAVEAQTGEIANVPAEGHPGEPQPNWGWQAWHKYWVEERIRFYENIGLPRTTLEEYWQKPDELAHYARATVDLLFQFPFGMQELEGIAARSDFDLSQHQRFSSKPQTVFDEELRTAWGKLEPAKQQELRERYYQARLKYLTKAGEPEEKATKQANEEADGLTKGNYVPHVIEPSAGVDRLLLALISLAYDEEEVTDEKGKTETRVVMRFHPRVAPIKVGVFPLLKNKPELVKKAEEVREMLRQHMTVFYDDGGAIGRRYRRQDEAGTPFGVTIDFDTIGERGDELKDTVTLRHRDSMTQERVKISDLLGLLLPQMS
ncbi:MAG: glycine--tRNA ligase [Verrucomicrobiaceae bacterium]|nr:MAG: glycine--tRNA ligase [Verrucomicrobiaceae bacterium]